MFAAGINQAIQNMASKMDIDNLPTQEEDDEWIGSLINPIR